MSAKARVVNGNLVADFNPFYRLETRRAEEASHAMAVLLLDMRMVFLLMGP